MKLIIEIPEEYYNCIKEIPVNTSTADMLIIRNGIPIDQCGDCIRRSDIGLTDFEIVMCNGDYKEGLKMLLDKIEKAPSATPMPKMGAWEWLSYEGIDEGNWHCSVCRMIIPRMPIDADGKPLYKCCPFCGSKNRGDAE